MKTNRPVILAMLAVSAVFCSAQSGAVSKPTGESSVTRDIVQRSRETWDAYKHRNVSAIKALTADEYVAHTLEGPSNLNQDIAALTTKKLTVESYTISDPKVSMATKDVAILRYKIDLKGTFAGDPLKPAYVTEVWVNRPGGWRIVSYSETPIR
jgi:hypothetical protein